MCCPDAYKRAVGSIGLDMGIEFGHGDGVGIGIGIRQARVPGAVTGSSRCIRARIFKRLWSPGIDSKE